MNQKQFSIQAFTLLELSIVIVIIGLIVADISAGQSLVRQASLRSISSELNEIRQSLNAFNLAYDAIPGDMSNAWDYWGTNCADTEANCNGNGNSKINNTTIKEEWMFWKHMSLAGTYPGTFAGTAVGGAYGSGNCLTGFNIPAAAIGSTGYRVESYSGAGAVVFQFNHPVNVMIQFGANVDNVVAGSCADNAALTPTETKALDTKLDDGFEKNGRLIADNTADGPNCLDGSNNYDLSQTTPQCRLFYDPVY